MFISAVEKTKEKEEFARERRSEYVAVLEVCDFDIFSLLIGRIVEELNKEEKRKEDICLLDSFVVSSKHTNVSQQLKHCLGMFEAG